MARLKRCYIETQNALNRRKIWTEKEIELVMKHEVPDPVLSGMIGRSVQAIHMKRHKTLYEMFGYDR